MKISRKIRVNIDELYLDVDTSFKEECLHTDITKNVYYYIKVNSIAMAVLKKIKKPSQD